MKLSNKISIFFTVISLLLLFFSFKVLKDTQNHLDNFEDKIVEKNIINFFDTLYQKYDVLKDIAFEYSTKEDIIQAINQKQKIDLKKYFYNEKFTHLFLFDKDYNFIDGNIYDINADEFIEASNLKQYLDLKKYINVNKINFITLEFEKLMFCVDEIKKDNKIIGYIFIARTLDSHFLFNLTKTTSNYVSFLPSHQLVNNNQLKINDQNISYDIIKTDENILYSQIQLNDEFDKKPFYISLKIQRDFFVQMDNDNKSLFKIFVITLIILLISLYIFINIIFTKRLETLTYNIKNISNSHSKRIIVNAQFNDEITYLSTKINDMLIAIDNTQHEEIKKERDFLQSVLDTQKNIILITDGNEIHSTNKKFVDNFQSKDLFLSNIALLDDATQANLLKIAKKFGTEENPVKLKVCDNKDRYFTFDVQKLDVTKYLICMNDVSTYNEKISHYKQKATIDELTSVYNKGTITEFTKQWLKIKSFSFAILDIDYFKKINDTYGHYIGDCILRDLSSLLKINLPKNDIVGRFGGEEFVILIDNNNLENVSKICERIRAIIEDFDFIYGELVLKITISLGFTFSKNNESFETLYTRADQGLYKAKENGRNMIIYNNYEN